MPRHARKAFFGSDKLAAELNILHVAQIDISRASGMGRVAWHWRAELERRGHRFTHVGRAPLGRQLHPALYPFAAWIAARRAQPRPDLVLVHEPACGVLCAGAPWPVIAFSHGVERRGWQIMNSHRRVAGDQVRLRARLTVPLWRLLGCDYGLRHADGVLVLNREDYDYCVARYRRRPGSIALFLNGIDPVAPIAAPPAASTPTVLFIGSWIARKGVRTLVEAAELLAARGVRLRWLLAGTGIGVAEVVSSWPRRLHADVEVVPEYDPRDEPALYARATVFALPSFFEGQPLALLQAMAYGLPVIATDCCGQRDMLSDTENGLLFAPGDACGLADRIAMCLDDAAFRSRLGAAAQGSVQGRTWARVAAHVASFIEQVYAERKRAK